MQAITSILRDSLRREVALVDYSTWLGQIRALGTDPQRNPGYPLLSFFQKDFLKLATGDVVLDSAKAAKESITLTTIGSFDRKYLLQQIMYWQSVGALG